MFWKVREALRCWVCHCKPNQILVQCQNCTNFKCSVRHIPLLDTLYPSLLCMLAFSFCSFGRVPVNQASKPSSPGAWCKKESSHAGQPIKPCQNSHHFHLEKLLCNTCIGITCGIICTYLHIVPVQVVWGAQSTRAVVIHLAEWQTYRSPKMSFHILSPVMSLFKYAHQFSHKRCRNRSPRIPHSRCQFHWSPTNSTSQRCRCQLLNVKAPSLAASRRLCRLDAVKRAYSTASGIWKSVNGFNQAANDIL